MTKIYKIFLNTIPVLVMVGLIPFILNDFILTAVFGVVILISFFAKREKNEGMVFITGLFLMAFFEYIFILTGVETFNRNSLLGIMPLWLPILWAYGFVAIDRAVKILDSNK